MGQTFGMAFNGALNDVRQALPQLLANALAGGANSQASASALPAASVFAPSGAAAMPTFSPASLTGGVVPPALFIGASNNNTASSWNSGPFYANTQPAAATSNASGAWFNAPFYAAAGTPGGANLQSLGRPLTLSDLSNPAITRQIAPLSGNPYGEQFVKNQLTLQAMAGNQQAIASLRAAAAVNAQAQQGVTATGAVSPSTGATVLGPVGGALPAEVANQELFKPGQQQRFRMPDGTEWLTNGPITSLKDLDRPNAEQLGPLLALFGWGMDMNLLHNPTGGFSPTFVGTSSGLNVV